MQACYLFSGLCKIYFYNVFFSGGRLIEIHNSDASQTLATTAVTAFGVEQPDFWIGICEQQDHGL